ncbi:MAG: SH3 domain-containing protein [Rhodocyclaceae bacterium]|nr:SH3 domain-containing protein [Rhodocyclaceae bacterium]
MARLIRLACLAVVLAAGFSRPVLATEFLSLAEAGVMYDAPSDKGKPLYVVQRYTPVEVVVNLERWVKVRDKDGTIAWMPKSSLATTRTVVATVAAQVRQAADASAPVVFQADRHVALELLEVAPPGWARVKHREGPEGFVRVEQVWGL